MCIYIYIYISIYIYLCELETMACTYFHGLLTSQETGAALLDARCRLAIQQLERAAETNQEYWPKSGGENVGEITGMNCSENREILGTQLHIVHGHQKWGRQRAFTTKISGR